MLWKSGRFTLCFSSAIAALLSPTFAAAADAADRVESDLQLEEVLVTAEKRSSSIDRVPVAVTAIGADTLSDGFISDIEGVSYLVPNFDFGEAFGAAKLSIRGISYSNFSTGAEGSIAYNMNDVYVARPAGQLGNFYDIERVEVLRGPQGTLYGRNATGGAVNFYSARPTDDLSGFGQVTGGSFGEVTVEGALSGPIVADILTGRVAVYRSTRDGYGKNLTTGTDIDDNDTKAARLTLMARPGNALTVTVIADAGIEEDRSKSTHVIAQGGLTGEPGLSGEPITGITLGGSAMFNSYDIRSDLDPAYRRENSGVAVDATLNRGSVVLRSTSGYRHSDFKLTSDLDGTDARYSYINYDEEADQFSQEFNLSYSRENFDLTLGLFGFWEDLDGFLWTPRYVPAMNGFISNYYGGGHLETEALAGYGQLSYWLTEKLTLVLGARYSTEKKSEDDFYTDFANSTLFLTPYDPNTPPVGAPFSQSKRWNAFTPKVGVNYQATPEMMLYASVSKGFKAGLFNIGASRATPGDPTNVSNPPVDPESVLAYEAGLKTRVFDNRMRFNAAGFYYDYEDLQLTKIQGTSVLLTNAAKARIYGIEIESQLRATEHLTLGLSGGWLHARFTDFTTSDPARLSLGALDLSGNSLPQAPDFSATASVEYVVPLRSGSLAFNADVNWVDRNYFSEFNRDVVSQSSFAKANAMLAYEMQNGFELAAYVKNIFDEETVETSYQSGGTVGFPVNGFLASPRTFGVRLRVQY